MFLFKFEIIQFSLLRILENYHVSLFSLLIVNYQDKSNTRPNSGGAHLEHSEHRTQLIQAQH